MVHPVLFDSLDAFAGSGARRGLDGVGIAGGVTIRLPAGARSRLNVGAYGSTDWTAALWSPDGSAGGRHVRGLPSAEAAEPSKPDPRGGGVSPMPSPFAGSGAWTGLDGVRLVGAGVCPSGVRWPLWGEKNLSAGSVSGRADTNIFRYPPRSPTSPLILSASQRPETEGGRDSTKCVSPLILLGETRFFVWSDWRDSDPRPQH